jgi:hypothetical protein
MPRQTLLTDRLGLSLRATVSMDQRAMIDFKGSHFEQDVILWVVRDMWHIRLATLACRRKAVIAPSTREWRFCFRPCRSRQPGHRLGVRRPIPVIQRLSRKRPFLEKAAIRLCRFRLSDPVVSDPWSMSRKLPFVRRPSSGERGRDVVDEHTSPRRQPPGGRIGDIELQLHTELAGEQGDETSRREVGLDVPQFLERDAGTR